MRGWFQVNKTMTVAFVALASTIVQFSPSLAQLPGPRTVRVTAQGATLEAAHNQAVRQALRQTVQQLVIADREINNDAIVRDKILSTMNGYVDGYTTLSKVRHPDGSWQVEEDITISQSRIINFIGGASRGGAPISGGLLSTDSERELAQRKARSEIFDRFLQPIPSRALDLSFDSIRLDERNPNHYILGVKAALSKVWLDSFRAALGALAVGGFHEPHNVGSPYARANPPRAIFFPPPYYKLNRPVASSLVCVIDDTSFDCFVLPPGYYGADTMMRGEDMSGAFEAPPVMLAIRFVDAAGRSTLTRGRPCIMKKVDRGPNHNGTRSLIGRSHGVGPLGRDYFILGTTAVGSVTIEASEVNMSATTRFAAVPFFAARQFGNYVSLHSGNVRRPDDPGVFAVSDISVAKVPQADVCGDMLNDAINAGPKQTR